MFLLGVKYNTLCLDRRSVKSSRLMRSLAFPLVLASLACSGSDKRASHPDSTGVAVATETVDASGTPPRDTVGGARPLQWTLADLDQTLPAIGLKAIVTGEVKATIPTSARYGLPGSRAASFRHTSMRRRCAGARRGSPRHG